MISYILMICDENLFSFRIFLERKHGEKSGKRGAEGTGVALVNSPAKMIPIDWQFCRGMEIVAYVEPRSAARPESSDCAGLIALPWETAKKNIIRWKLMTQIASQCNRIVCVW